MNITSPFKNWYIFFGSRGNHVHIYFIRHRIALLLMVKNLVKFNCSNGDVASTARPIVLTC